MEKLLVFVPLIGLFLWFITIIVSFFLPNRFLWIAALAGLLAGLSIGIYMKGFPSGLIFGVLVGVVSDIVLISSALYVKYFRTKGLNILRRHRKP